ncbi:MAG: NAD-dependent deacetylase [SAR86 cluster bacterium]|uniref:protein acetyllysine N-acetyltransferase n=1 Tax=SAR86 cluster bacterium TaxID=2030880 RepID=A0A838Y6F2_9GAMM|nr:NAD-dependent deacetylase [SAR86 cluster bacterium]
MNTFNKIIKLIKTSKKTIVLTGAGISTESGLPDFRSKDGFWTKNKPIQFQDYLDNEEQQRLSWSRNIELHEILKKIRPNIGHTFVEKIVNLNNKENFLITQNIDGLHQRSGVSEDKIIEIHGNAIDARCLNCGETADILDFHAAIKANNPLPKCINCNGIVKVATISFGQPMNESDMLKASKISSECELMIVMGSSLSVMPAGQIPNLAIKSGAKLVILNREETIYDAMADIVINDELEIICGELIKLI